MAKSLVIVESPAKAKTINKYLGDGFIVKSSVGHIRDLPTSGGKTTSTPQERAKAAAITRKLSPKDKIIHKQKKAKEQLITRMGVDPEHDWAARYEILPGKEKVVSELQRLAKNADQIYLATDLDREGEAIAWHLKEAIGGDDSRYKRVVFNEITKNAIQEAFKKPGELDIARVQAQQARRFLDRVVGFMVSPLLWQKVARGLSAGRVQSVAVRLIVERETEIRAFVPEEFWELFADLMQPEKDDVSARFDVVKYQGENFRPSNEAQVKTSVALLEKAEYVVAKREDRPTKSKPNPPFITSTLQQAASTRLGFSVKKTMMLAQRLYEAGYITYMRTDSTNLSKDAVEVCRQHIVENLGEKYLFPEVRVYTSKEQAQEAHEAIRPSDVAVELSNISGLEKDAERLYQLIWCQFVACQMADARYLSSSIQLSAGEFELKTKGRVMQFDGYLKVMSLLGFGKGNEDIFLPDFKKGEVLSLQKLDPKQHFTKPSARYSEASLVKELEKRGIGRPSTYAAIISTIQDRGYVRLQNRRFYSEKMGDIVAERLVESFKELMGYGFTADMESALDKIANNEVEWKQVLDDFYHDFTIDLEKAKSEDHGMRENDPTETDIPCPDCARPMQIRTASTGVFLGCSGYSLPPKERCKKTINLVSADEFVSADEDLEGEAESRLLRKKHRCKICDTAMDSYIVDESRKLYVCGRNPDCSGFDVEQGTFVVKGYEGPTLDCDKCGQEMQLKNGRFGKYFGCTNEECKNTRKLLRSVQPAPPKMDPVPMPELKCVKVEDTYILRDGASGLFLAASQFPKNRETRAPLVKELISHREEIDPKYDFLFSAPQSDPAGNNATIRYSRKSKEQYVMTEVEGKATGWSAWFENGTWAVRDTKKKPKKKAS